MNINKSFINDLRFDGAERTYFDDSLKGFGVRVRKDSASYIVMYRNAYGKQKKLTIAKTSQITPAQAREEAKRILALVVQGKDPQNDRIEKRKALTVAELADSFYEKRKIRIKPNTRTDYENHIRNHIKPSIGKMIVKEVLRGDIQRLYDDLLSGSYVKERFKREDHKFIATANNCLCVLSGMFEYAVDNGLMEHNPCRRIKKMPNNKREIFLDENGLKRLGEALRQSNYLDKYALNSVRLLVMTGCRCNEIMTLKWKYIDFESQVFRFPDTKTGAQNRPFGIAAKKLLLKMKMEIRPENDEDFVFPRVKKTADVAKNIFKRTIKKYPGLENLCAHALRHSFASMAAALGYSDAIIAGLLGHKLHTITNRYTHLTDKSLIQAADAVSEKIAELIGI